MYVYVIVNLAKMQRRSSPETWRRTETPSNINSTTFLHDTLPESGGVMEARPACFWVRMPLPFALDHINLWLLRDQIDGEEGGWTVIDCGIASDTIRANWERVFDSVLDGLPVLRVIVTHCHPDHCRPRGLGLQRRRPEALARARLWISLGEYAMGRVMAAGDGSNARRRAARRGISRGTASPTKRRSRRCASATATTRLLVPSIARQFRRMRDSGRADHRRGASGEWCRAMAIHLSIARCYCARDGRADLRRHGAAAHFDERRPVFDDGA